MSRKLFSILILVTIILTACTPASPAETIKMKIVMQPYLNESPYFLAQDLGYFAEQGLDVEFVRYENSAEVLPALINGDLDVTTVVMNAGYINAVAHDSNIKIVAGKGFLNPDTCGDVGIVARPDLLSSMTLDDPKNWNGLKIATDFGRFTEYAIDTLLIQNGLTSDTFEFVDLPIPNRLDGLMNKVIDLAGANEPWVTRMINAGAAEMWIPFKEITPNAPWSMVVFGPSILEKNPEMGQRFMVAYLKGVEAFNEGKTDSNLSIISKYTELSLDELKSMCWVDMAPDGSVDFTAILGYEEWALEKGYIEETVTKDQLWDPQFIEYAQKKLK